MAHEPPGRGNHEKLNVLLVDDDATIRSVLGAFLTQRGHRVITAGTEHDALRCLEAATFDVVVTDVLLPDGDGIDLMRTISLRPTPQRVVAITGGSRYFGPKFFERVAASLGAIVLQKPFGREAFIQAIEGSMPTAAA